MPKEIRHSILINTNRERVWDALTNPDKVQQYMFGSRCRSNWQGGNPVEYYMLQEGKEITIVHGQVIKVEPHSYLEHTIFPTGSDFEDIPKNHLITIYQLEKDDGSTLLTVLQRGFETVANGEARYQDASQGWDAILIQLKEVAEAG